MTRYTETPRDSDRHAWATERCGTGWACTIWHADDLTQLRRAVFPSRLSAMAWGVDRIRAERVIRQFLALDPAEHPRAEYIDAPPEGQFPAPLDALRDFERLGPAWEAARGLTVELVADRLDWIAGRTVTL